MFTNISWKEYALIVTVALLLYYVWIFFIFYAKDILRLFKKTTVEDHKLQNESEIQSAEIFGIVYRLQDEVKEAIEAAAIKKYPKEEIIFSLQTALQKYSLQSTPFRFALNNFIERQCKNNCFIHLSEDDLKQMWG